MIADSIYVFLGHVSLNKRYVVMERSQLSDSLCCHLLELHMLSIVRLLFSYVVNCPTLI